ncbi:MAG TPA: alpha/beta hydrolase, partial [Candidatus Marinimicrobia bacterium]|nr:alpha/beta hydrolase [Candidatus Neomarinimicrobiota bacterium]
TLNGWWIPAKEAKSARPLIILVHGWGSNAARMLPCIEALYDENYHFIAFDARSHGSSGKDGYSTMVKFGEDIQSAILWALSHKVEQICGIGVMGHSIGGAGTLYAASRTPLIKAVVTVGAFADPRTVMAKTYHKTLKIPSILIPLIFKQMEWRLGFRFEDIAPVNILNNIFGKMLIVHGTDDEIVPFSEAEKLAEKAMNWGNLQFLPLAGKKHSDCRSHPNFWPTVKTFLKSSLAD